MKPKSQTRVFLIILDLPDRMQDSSISQFTIVVGSLGTSRRVTPKPVEES
jgi:hypothetical protein